MAIRRIVVALGLGVAAVPADAQFFAFCDKGSVSELQESLRAHSQHVRRLENKFEHIWYLQGSIDTLSLHVPTLDELGSFLDRVEKERGRRAAILYYAYSWTEHQDRKLRLCSWLITAGSKGPPRVSVANLDPAALESMRSLVQGAMESYPSPALDAVVINASNVLLPEPIASGILADGIDTLVVVPVALAIPGTPGRRDASSFIASVGTMPFSLLRVGAGREKALVDVASVIIAPGFGALSIGKGQKGFAGDPVVVISPKHSNWPADPQAGLEAMALGQVLESDPLIGRDATPSAVRARLQDKAAKTSLVYFSTHGVSDPTQPLDGSYLVLSDAPGGPLPNDGRLTARQISELKLQKGPLVVLSACDTGLGKDFQVGTIGLARAWQFAGASSVIMTLWKVQPAVTRLLMVDLMRNARTEPPDKALRRAMLAARSRDKDPRAWAGIAAFGGSL